MFIGRLFPSIFLLTRRTEMGVDEKITNKDKNKRKKRKHARHMAMIHTSFFRYRNDKSCTIYRPGKRRTLWLSKKKKSTDEGGLQNNQIKTQPKRTTI